MAEATRDLKSATLKPMTELEQVVEALLVSIPERLKDNQSAESRQKLAWDAEKDLSKWIAWPGRAVLLWKGCVRDPVKMPAEWIKWKRSRSGKKSWEYEYPPELDSLLRRNRIPPNTRMRNGPPQTTYQFAGGGYTTVNDPEHHHIYDGNDRHSMSPVDPLHAVNHPSHLTQSAGIVVLTHDAHRHCHTDAHLRLLLRLIAWLNFGYDPEKLFGPTRDDGFAENYSSEKVYPPT